MTPDRANSRPDDALGKVLAQAAREAADAAVRWWLARLAGEEDGRAVDVALPRPTPAGDKRARPR